MRFIMTTDGQYLAIDTIAKIKQVEISYTDGQALTFDTHTRKTTYEQVPVSVKFSITTKRGEQHDAKASAVVFNKLIHGGD